MNTNPKSSAHSFKPSKSPVRLADGLAWSGGGGFHYTRKYDGVFKTLKIRSEFQVPSSAFRVPRSEFLLAVEEMRPKSGGAFTAADRARFAQLSTLNSQPVFHVALGLLAVDGQDVTHRPRRETWPELVRLINAERGNIILPDSGNGGEFLQAVIAAGGEGVMAAAWDAPWTAPVFAAKRAETFQVVVTGWPGGTQSVPVRLLDAETFRVPRSAFRVPLLGGKCDRVRPGSVLKVEGVGLTAEGKIREPRVCRDTPTSWLVRF